jgi:hypothetical protein
MNAQRPDDPRRANVAAATTPIVLDEAEDELLSTLQEAQLVLLKHPVAAQAVLKALVAEGRRFATTPAGRRWRAKLAGSELVRRGRIAWQGSALTMLEERGDGMLPSSLLDAILGALTSGGLATLLSRLAQPEADEVDARPS